MWWNRHKITITYLSGSGCDIVDRFKLPRGFSRGTEEQPHRPMVSGWIEPDIDRAVVSADRCAAQMQRQECVFV